jgi:D-isomer specific 2-hydroxyacid dehydrogenase, NAD binding domain
MLINTGRGAIVNTQAVIAGLKSGAMSHLGLDVYEEEAGLFFEDLSDELIRDDVFARPLTFPNVLVTGHQGFLTAEALSAIAETTIADISAFEATGHAVHKIAAPQLGFGSLRSCCVVSEAVAATNCVGASFWPHHRAVSPEERRHAPSAANRFRTASPALRS